MYFVAIGKQSVLEREELSGWGDEKLCFFEIFFREANIKIWPTLFEEMPF
jgi:hypothetical protein